MEIPALSHPAGTVGIVPWIYNPHAGGTKVPPKLQEETRARVLTHAAQRYPGRYDRIDVRFRGALCYIDAYCNGSGEPIHLVRLRYFSGRDAWSVAFFTYSREKYEPCMFPNGTFHGTPEDAFDIGAVYLE